MNTWKKRHGAWCVLSPESGLAETTVTVTSRKGRVKQVKLGELKDSSERGYLYAIAPGDLGASLIASEDDNGAESVQGTVIETGETFTLTPPPAPKPKGNNGNRRRDAAQALLDIFEGGATVDEDAVRAIVREELSKSASITRIEVKNRSQKLATLEGHFHPMFPTLCKMASAFQTDGYVPGIYIAGEASSGKTYATKMLAKALSLPWRFNGAISQPHEMLGFIDGAGRYHRTPFREAYEHGGVYTFDEVDRSDPNALLAVNPHLANGTAEFPDGQIARHPDCVIICTANTWGTGADAQYVGATKLDAAFLSRFPCRLQWNIDEAFERSIIGNDRWCARVQAARKRAKAVGLKVMIDVRINQAGAALIEAGMTDDDAAAQTYLANLKPEQIKMVEGR